MRRFGALIGLLSAALGGVGARGEDTPSTSLPAVDVVGVSPVVGGDISRDRLPASIGTLRAEDLVRRGVPELAGTLLLDLPAVSVNDVQGNPFQPDVQYRGFSASPVVGMPQGLAVYQNGVRINEAFGDVVNWDLIPEVAIDRLDLISGDPVFGLNALGGALTVQMKTGFTFEGFQIAGYGGSFGRRAGSVQYGVKAGDFASYAAAEILHDDGWRRHSGSDLRRLYADLGARGEDSEFHLNVTAAGNRFGATGTVPAELLAADRRAVFTTPQTYANDLAFVSLNGTHHVTPAVSLQGNLYYRNFRQHAVDGNASDIAACDSASETSLLCLGNAATPLFGAGGNTVSASILGGGVAGTIDRTTIASEGRGGSLQLTSSASLWGHGNHLTAGISYDRGVSDYSTGSELGTLGDDLAVSGTGIVIAQPDREIAAVRVRATNDYYGVYAADTFDLAPGLAATAGARFNAAEIRLQDRGGAALNGDHWYARLNPALGGTYELAGGVTAYAGYSEANRAPTPSELGCADPARPCLLANFVVSDPPLKQVVGRTYQAGLRGKTEWAGAEGHIDWNLGLFRTDLSDDIIVVASPLTGRGFFQNAGATRRQGIEANLRYRSDHWRFHAGYALVDATFQSSLILPSPENPAATDGVIAVHPGNRLPSIPQHRFNAGVEYAVTPRWKLGADLIVASGQYLRGDEVNQNPKIPGYWVVNLHTSYQASEQVELFADIKNLFDRRYATFGSFFDPASVPFLNLANPRSLGPAAPLAVYAGIRVRL